MYSFQSKLKIIEHVDSFGIQSAIHAFGVKKSSIYAWKKKLLTNHGIKSILKNKSTKPNKLRTRVGTWDYRIVEFIQRVRIEHMGLSHEKVHKLLIDHSKDQDWRCSLPGKSTIARMIRDLKNRGQIPVFRPSLSFYANTSTFRVKPKKRKIKNRPNKTDIIKPGQRIQIDTVILILTGGIRRYIIQATDIYSRISFSYAYRSPSSKNSTDFFNKLIQVMPFIQNGSEFQNDNGSEFLGYFQKALKQANMVQLWNYPKHPKMNAYIERFNRTSQEEFIYKHAYLLRDDIQQFNIKLMDYLVWYNTKRPHFSLDLKSPVEFILSQNQFSKMWWEDAATLQILVIII